MSKQEAYRAKLAELTDWDEYLVAESGLPGPRGNLELIQAAADLGSESQFRRWLTPEPYPKASPSAGEYLAACGAVGLGRLIASGRLDLLAELRHHASDSRWRVREGVAMALQRVGAVDMPALLEVMRSWSDGNLLERRAVVAALCEPALLRDPADAAAVLRLLDAITESLPEPAVRRSEDFRVLRQTLGYGWSVAIASLPGEGLSLFEKWLTSPDPDVRWILRQNLLKKRLQRIDRERVTTWITQLDQPVSRLKPTGTLGVFS